VADEEEADMLRTRIITSIGAVALVLAVPGSSAAQDLRTPDARTGIAPAEAGQELRTPDARSAADPDAASREPRAIDARGEAAAGRELPSPASRGGTRPSVAVEARDPIQPVGDASDGFGWGDAGIGAAGTLGIVLALAGIGLLTTHVRRRQQLSVGGR
jgi:hypothetical protein